MVAYRHLYPSILYNIYPKSANNSFKVYQYSGSWCILHQADTAMVKPYPISIQRSAAPSQLLLPYSSRMNNPLLQAANKPNLPMQHR